MGERSPRSEQFELRARRDQPLRAVEDIDDMATIRSDEGNPDPGPAMQVQMLDLGGAELEMAAQVCYQGPDERALLLQGVHIPEPQVELNGTEPHSHPRKRRAAKSLCVPAPPSTCRTRFSHLPHIYAGQERESGAGTRITRVNFEWNWSVSMV
jgi:hypothetical protein